MNTLKVLSYLGWGIAHEKIGIPCQDAVGYRKAENGSLILALSDGASGAACAEQAAHLYVQAVLDLFTRMSLSTFLLLEQSEQRTCLLNACKQMICASVGLEELRTHTPADYSATLLFAVLHGQHWLVGHLGDGAIFAPAFCSSPEQVHGSNQETYFVTSLDAMDHFRLTEPGTDPPDVLLLMSDGAYPMFEARGGGDAAATAEELFSYIRRGELNSNEDLADILNQMAELPSERLDDWSLLLWSQAAQAEEEPVPPVRSMLREEKEKYAAEKFWDAIK